MRKQFCEALVCRSRQPNVVFLTGDLGFMALEPLQAALGERFINAGVAEQNMISVAAALARQGFEAWTYSIAPFSYGRPFEQIRNDVAMHNLPVRIVGNGGGYSYGVMGPTHHAIEDYGTLLALPNIRAFVPVFDEDVHDVVTALAATAGPTYLRLGRGEPPQGFEVPPYRAWRQLVAGCGIVVVAVGPIASTYVEPFAAIPEAVRPKLWAVGELPIRHDEVPNDLLKQIERSPGLCVAEEHVRHGGFASDLLLFLAEVGIATPRFAHHFAIAHTYKTYGSQKFLRKLSRLDPASLLETIHELTPSPTY